MNMMPVSIVKNTPMKTYSSTNEFSKAANKLIKELKEVPVGSSKYTEVKNPDGSLRERLFRLLLINEVDNNPVAKKDAEQLKLEAKLKFLFERFEKSTINKIADLLQYGNQAKHIQKSLDISA